jgi:hypothetical protein
MSWDKFENIPLQGTVTILQGTDVVNGTGTQFLTELKPRNVTIIGNTPFVVKNVISSTQYTVTTQAPATLTAQTVVKQTPPTYLSDDDLLNNTVFISIEEAKNPDNKKYGISGPGWYLWKERVDQNSNTRINAELIVAMKSSDAVSGDLDNFNSIYLSILTQPTSVIYSGSGNVVYTSAAELNVPGTITYQWQYLLNGTWTNLTNGVLSNMFTVSGATTNTLTLSSIDLTPKVVSLRMMISSVGAETKYTNVATLTVE